MKMTTKENDRLKEMVDMLKHRLIEENCFNITYIAQKLSGDLPQIKSNQELIVGFVRDHEGAEEFYLQIKQSSQTVRIPTSDIDEIEHVEGTFQFYVHY